MEKLSFVIPCYKSEYTIESVAGEINSLMASHPEYDYETILVNDCSPDNVWEKISALHNADPSRVKAINLAKNFGQHSALMAGYNICTGDYVVTIDDDGQTPVDEVFKLLRKITLRGGGMMLFTECMK